MKGGESQGDPASGCYFERQEADRFLPTPLTSGAWNTEEQHVAPLFGLLVHAIEQDHLTRRDNRLAICRVSYDILGVLPLDPFHIEVSVMRAGRTIELVEARAIQNGRPAVVARAWLAGQYDTAMLAGVAFPDIPHPDRMEPSDPGAYWAGGFVRSVEVRRESAEAGRGFWWCRTDNVLLAGEEVSGTAYALGLLDLANGIAPRVAPDAAMFPNLDLTVHLFRAPRGPWIGFDTSVSIGTTGVGLTHSILHDLSGPIGSVAQILTVRPRN